jgi:hypothetical protein
LENDEDANKEEVDDEEKAEILVSRNGLEADSRGSSRGEREEMKLGTVGVETKEER